MGRVVVIGSLNVDEVTRVDRLPGPGETVIGWRSATVTGGKGANQAVAARGAGAQVAMVGCVGADSDGQAYVAGLISRGIDTSAIRSVSDEATGRALIVVDDAGENSIIVLPGANMAMTTEDLAALAQLEPGDVVLLQLEVPRPVVEAAARTAADRGARVVLNCAPYAAVAPDVVALADPVVVNEHEALLLADSGLVPTSLLVTFGAAGVRWDGVQADGIAVPEPEVVDATGAGDAFCGALAAALAAGADRAVALDRALSAGAAAVRHSGAQPQP